MTKSVVAHRLAKRALGRRSCTYGGCDHRQSVILINLMVMSWNVFIYNAEMRVAVNWDCLSVLLEAIVGIYNRESSSNKSI